MGNLKIRKILILPPGGNTLTPAQDSPFFYFTQESGGCKMAYKLIKASDSFAPRGLHWEGDCHSHRMHGERREGSVVPPNALVPGRYHGAKKNIKEGVFMKEKIVEIDGKQIIVKEMKTEKFITLFQSDDGIQMLIGLMSGLPDDIKRVMKSSVDISEEEFEALTEGINAFSVLEQAFREVNQELFNLLPKKLESLLGLGELLAGKFGIPLKRTG